MAQTNLDQRSNGGGSGRHALAPTVLIDPFDELPRHGNGDALWLQAFLDHAPIMRNASPLDNAPSVLVGPTVQAV